MVIEADRCGVLFVINKIENKEMTERERESNERGRTGGGWGDGKVVGREEEGGIGRKRKKNSNAPVFEALEFDLSNWIASCCFRA